MRIVTNADIMSLIDAAQPGNIKVGAFAMYNLECGCVPIVR